MKVNKFLICLVLAFVTSCGTIQSTGAIVKADRAKEAALKKIVDVSKDDTLLERDSFGNETLSREASGEAAYFFFLAEAYLHKARNLHGKSEHEQARDIAIRARRFFLKVMEFMSILERGGEVNGPAEKGPASVKVPVNNGKSRGVELQQKSPAEAEKPQKNNSDKKQTAPLVETSGAKTAAKPDKKDKQESPSRKSASPAEKSGDKEKFQDPKKEGESSTLEPSNDGAKGKEKTTEAFSDDSKKSSDKSEKKESEAKKSGTDDSEKMKEKKVKDKPQKKEKKKEKKKKENKKETYADRYEKLRKAAKRKAAEDGTVRRGDGK